MLVIYKMIYSTEKEVSSIDLYASLDEVVKVDFKEDEIALDSISAFDMNEEMQLIAIVSSGCKYCRLGLKKLSLIMKNALLRLPESNLKICGAIH